MSIIENQKEWMEQDSRDRATEALKKRNSLKVHRIVVEHRKHLNRETIFLLGYDIDQDFNSWRLAGQLLHGPDEMKQWNLSECTGQLHTIQFVPVEVRRNLVLSWVQYCTKEEKQEILEYLEKEKESK